MTVALESASFCIENTEQEHGSKRESSECGPLTNIGKASSLGHFLYSCLQIPGIHVSLEAKLGRRVVSEKSEQAGKMSWKVISLAREQESWLIFW